MEAGVGCDRPVADLVIVSNVAACGHAQLQQETFDLLASLVRSLKNKHALLIFDNCEHLIGGASRAIGALLQGCPELRILASSRQALGIAGEATFLLPSLETPPEAETALTATEAASWAGIALFVERARAADPRFVLSDAHASTVADICRRLDGIALAIELAASRIKLLTPPQLAAKLSELLGKPVPLVASTGAGVPVITPVPLAKTPVRVEL